MIPCWTVWYQFILSTREIWFMMSIETIQMSSDWMMRRTPTTRWMLGTIILTKMTRTRMATTAAMMMTMKV